MLNSQGEINLISILTRMHESNYEFHLTGSRYFYPNRSTGRDFDFFTGDNMCISFLEDLGFEKLKYSYDDISVNVVYRHPSCSVDVQILVSPGHAKRKTKAQALLKSHGYLEPPRNLWSMVLIALEYKV